MVNLLELSPLQLLLLALYFVMELIIIEEEQRGLREDPVVMELLILLELLLLVELINSLMEQHY